MSAIEQLGVGSIPRWTNWEYASAAARTGATGFVASDVGKIAKQTDNGTYWELTAVTPTWSQIGVSTLSASFTVNAEVTNNITVDVQIQKDGANVTEEYSLFFWLSDLAKDTEASAAPNGGVTVGDSNGFTLKEFTTNITWQVITSSSGAIDFVIGDTGTPTFYLNVILPDGTIATSDAITFA